VLFLNPYGICSKPEKQNLFNSRKIVLKDRPKGATPYAEQFARYF